MDAWAKVGDMQTNYRPSRENPSKVVPLESYWQQHHYREDEETARPASTDASPSTIREKRRRTKSSPSSHLRTRNRAVSSASALAPPGATLSTHHPALSFSAFLDTFGPLVFPLYKAALLRKRILLVGHAPVEFACNLVYDISVISTLPSALHDLLPLSPLPTRFRPLFAVGVHDIPTLSTGSRTSRPTEPLANGDQAYGWVACTTDDILSVKSHLFDTLVTLPPSYSAQAQSKIWPKIQGKKGPSIKATQRDARRYEGLRKDLGRYRSASPRSPPESHPPAQHANAEDNEGTAPLLSLPALERTTTDRGANFASPPDDERPILEPQSWSALAYNSYMWWASAGEKRTDLEEESEYDSSLLANLGSSEPHSPSRRRRSDMRPDDGVGGDDSVGFEMAVIAYFHRYTVLILRTLSEIVEGQHAGSEDESGRGRLDREGAGKVIEITSDDLTRMGLDIWSESDRLFVEELVDFYWGRRAVVKGGRVDCCGIRVL
ncbi:MAG: hypothetical protein Q9219_004951 [cf. Caloplaca sp. 3 TL-2023]